MTNKQMQKTSKFISLILRHDPSAAGITLDEQGWANVEALLNGLAKHGHVTTHDDLFDIVEQDEKKRYSFNEDQTKIRANQGHSLKIDLGLVEKQPPDVLLHGTGVSVLEAIWKEGIKKMERQHVHLSKDIATAMKVGSRHGMPGVIEIDAKQMYTDCYKFYESENGVWLTEYVPTKYCKLYGSE